MTLEKAWENQVQHEKEQTTFISFLHLSFTFTPEHQSLFPWGGFRCKDVHVPRWISCAQRSSRPFIQDSQDVDPPHLWKVFGATLKVHLPVDKDFPEYFLSAAIFHSVLMTWQLLCRASSWWWNRGGTKQRGLSARARHQSILYLTIMRSQLSFHKTYPELTQWYCPSVFLQGPSPPLTSFPMPCTGTKEKSDPAKISSFMIAYIYGQLRSNLI